MADRLRLVGDGADVSIDIADPTQHPRDQRDLVVVAVDDLLVVNGDVLAALAPQQLRYQSLEGPELALPLVRGGGGQSKCGGVSTAVLSGWLISDPLPGRWNQ
jgi:hypothetical protein